MPSKKPTFMIVIDAFIFPKTDAVLIEKEQHILAGLLLKPNIQTAFSLSKGSIPSVVTPEFLAKTNHCSKKALIMLDDPNMQIPSVAILSHELFNNIIEMYCLFILE